MKTLLIYALLLVGLIASVYGVYHLVEYIRECQQCFGSGLSLVAAYIWFGFYFHEVDVYQEKLHIDL